MRSRSRLSSEVDRLVAAALEADGQAASRAAPPIRKHVFFQKDDFDWGKLLRLELPPPYVPKIKSETDVSNFDRIESKVDFSRASRTTSATRGSGTWTSDEGAPAERAAMCGSVA